MTWAISVAIFLGTVLAVLVVIFVWSQREEIREALREHRRESRIPADISLELAELDETVVETAPTENISRHGARVLTTRRWRPHERVLIGLAQAVERSHARIAYCDPLSGHSFAVGLKFSSAFNEWNPSDLEWSDHPYRK
jgi:heme exporter protein D